MKKFMKILLVAVMSVMLICSFALATGNELGNAAGADNEVTTENPFDLKAGDAGQVGDAIDTLGGTAIKIAQTLGYIIAVVMVLVVGIQWVMATPQKKQELKGRMWNIVIGAALIVGASTFLGFINSTVISTFGK